MSRSGNHKRRKLGQEQPEEGVFPPSYQYDILEGNNDVRLIALLPRQFHVKVRFEFIICDLKDPPDYEALSYTWADSDGDQSLDGTVWCEPGSQKIFVTRNCENALRRLRLRHEPRFLWVDAISINQTVIPERNRQVSMMPMIYHTASRVMVYLGEATAETNDFMDSLNSGQLTAQLGFEKCLPPGIAILSRRWFTRLWVLQEISLARAASIICGDKITPWKKLFEYYKSVFTQSARFNNVQHLEAIFAYGLKGIQPLKSFPKLFMDSHQQACSDPRDRVFALLGIVAKDHSLEMMPEYGALNWKIFTELAVKFVKEFNLLFADETLAEPPSGWSSWVFDWSRHRKHPIYHLPIDNVLSFCDLKNNRGILEISGQQVMDGVVCKEHYRRPLISGDETWRRIVVNGGRTTIGVDLSEGTIVVEVSNGFCVLLSRIGDHYSLLGGIADYQRCQETYKNELGRMQKLHDKPGQCTSTCSLSHLMLESPKSFAIL